MTKLLVSCLVLSALLVLSHCTDLENEVIVKDGHRVVVVEYDRDGKTNTRVSIQPPGKEEEKRRDKGEKFGNAKRETASSSPEEKEREHHVSPGELVCDAGELGKCKHKMATLLGRFKDLTAGDELSDEIETPKETVARAARDVEKKAREVEEPVNERATKKAHKSQNVWEEAKIAVRGIGTMVGKALGLTKIGSVIDLVGIAAAYGMCVWVTFVSGYVLGSVLGRQQYAVVQSKMYPVYFKAVSVGILFGLLGHVISRRRKVFTDAVDMWQAVNLLSSILMVEANASFVDPRVTKAMFERIKAEKEDGRGLDTSESESSETGAQTIGKKVREKLDEDGVKQRHKKLSERHCRLNAYSSRLNLLTLMSLTWHFVYLGHRLNLT